MKPFSVFTPITFLPSVATLFTPTPSMNLAPETKSKNAIQATRRFSEEGCFFERHQNRQKNIYLNKTQVFSFVLVPHRKNRPSSSRILANDVNLCGRLAKNQCISQSISQTNLDQTTLLSKPSKISTFRCLANILLAYRPKNVVLVGMAQATQLRVRLTNPNTLFKRYFKLNRLVKTPA